MDIINQHFINNPDWPRPRLECKDGFEISVQAHYGAYCTPRANGLAGEYTHVECGFPSSKVPELDEWKDGDRGVRETDTESVYGYVPIPVVLALIESHGGLK
jgi:hypothetical protein